MGFIVINTRNIATQMAEIAIPRELFAEILPLIAELRTRPAPASAQLLLRDL